MSVLSFVYEYTRMYVHRISPVTSDKKRYYASQITVSTDIKCDRKPIACLFFLIVYGYDTWTK